MPYQLYRAARTRWSQQTYPRYLSYKVVVSVVEASKRRVERYDAAYNAESGALWVDTFSDYERAHPHTPSGINVPFFGRPEPSPDFLGVPLLTPNYSFGLSFLASPRLAERPAEDSAGGESTPSLQTIATVFGSTGSDYAVALSGVAFVSDHRCYHLLLRPLHDPNRLRLRDLWMDAGNATTWRLRVARNFTNGAGAQASWIVDYADIGGSRFIANETAEGPLRVRGLVYQQTSVAFEQITATPSPVDRELFLPESPNDLLSEPAKY